MTHARSFALGFLAGAVSAPVLGYAAVQAWMAIGDHRAAREASRAGSVPTWGWPS